jgi:hypothetical protein
MRREFRILVVTRPPEAVRPALRALREDLIRLAGGFTEIEAPHGLRFIVCLAGRDAKKRVQRLVALWKGRWIDVRLEDRRRSADCDEIYFLLPLQRNPDPSGTPRRPLFTNEDLADLRMRLATRFHFRPEMVGVYGEWRDDEGRLIPDISFLVRVPRRGPGTVPALRRFLKRHILANPRCDQDCLYLSNRWRGEYVRPE